MATVDVAVSSDMSPQRAWELASDLGRFDEWLSATYKVAAACITQGASKAVFELTARHSAQDVEQKARIWLRDQYPEATIAVAAEEAGGNWLFFETPDSNLVSLDAGTGKELWQDKYPAKGATGPAIAIRCAYGPIRRATTKSKVCCW